MPYMKAKKAGTCRICGEAINAGDEIGWWPRWGAKHAACTDHNEAEHTPRWAEGMDPAEVSPAGYAVHRNLYYGAKPKPEAPREKRYWFVMALFSRERRWRSHGRYRSKRDAEKLYQSLRSIRGCRECEMVQAHSALEARGILSDREAKAHAEGVCAIAKAHLAKPHNSYAKEHTWCTKCEGQICRGDGMTKVDGRPYHLGCSPALALAQDSDAAKPQLRLMAYV